ncbi:hypothetical protein RhiirB3_482080 [Rhizophagus irregularis]|nr:hypothetical protein RhiirB3_482080 [Rhizophagus irregularis]
MKVVLSEKEKKTFLDQMIELKRNGCRNPFVKISDSINSIRKQGDPYNSRQLCHFWRNYLDPDVCQENLDDKEKKYIDDWISLHKSEDGGIVWKKLRQDLKNQFGPFRSENKLKNYWYSKQRMNFDDGFWVIWVLYIDYWVGTGTSRLYHSLPFIGNFVNKEKEIKYKEPLIRQVNHGPFSDDEKNYIYEWANSQTKNCDAIRWEFLQIEIQNNFDRIHYLWPFMFGD